MRGSVGQGIVWWPDPSPFVIPAQAGIQQQVLNWIPACAGMTMVYKIQAYTANLRENFNSLLPQPGHQLHEIAGPVTAVELFGKDAVPPVLNRAVRSGQGKDIGSA